MKLNPDTLKQHAARTREHRCKKPCEKADCRRTCDGEDQLELPLEYPDERD